MWFLHKILQNLKKVLRTIGKRFDRNFNERSLLASGLVDAFKPICSHKYVSATYNLDFLSAFAYDDTHKSVFVNEDKKSYSDPSNVLLNLFSNEFLCNLLSSSNYRFYPSQVAQHSLFDFSMLQRRTVMLLDLLRTMYVYT